ncbi:hypothetical protein F5Y18DRAFT_388264 [Xylariaceae sp. FL1019]|nr:hypothetical protein F5Y18DRAFT_388264 [Xylariaceae sp. FL1019]
MSFESDQKEAVSCNGDEKGLGEGKGKEKVREDQQSARLSSRRSGDSAQLQSTTSRMASTATSVASGLFSGRGDGQYLDSFLSPGHKTAGPSSLISRSSPFAQETAQVVRSQSIHGRRPGTTFRSPSDSGPAGDGKPTWLETDDAERGTGDGNQEAQRSHATAMSMMDGFEVVQLLETGTESEAYIHEDGDLPMSNREVSALRQALFEGGAASRSLSWDDTLNFMPDSLADYLDIDNVHNARLIWAQQWQDVLSSYNAEVWGDLDTLVKAASRELDNVSKGARAETAPEPRLDAVRRLRQILAHIRGS